MSKNALVFEGTIVNTFKGAMFTVRLDTNNHEVLAGICGKIRKNMIRILPGDRCLVELSEYDLSRGRIVRRLE